MAARSVPPSSRGGAQLVWMRFSAARECAPSPQTTRASTYGAELLLLSRSHNRGEQIAIHGTFQITPRKISATSSTSII